MSMSPKVIGFAKLNIFIDGFGTLIALLFLSATEQDNNDI